jgi:TolB-like protein/cytochrome c-type biogenesis protein CcmH/NrfG
VLAPLALSITVLALWLVPKLRDVAQAPDLAARPAIAVLPFQIQGEDPAREYLADGITQDIINSLGRFSALTVMSWNAVAPYKGAAVRPGEIARVLAVRYQVEGSVAYSGERMRVSAQLADVRGRVLWSARFDEASIEIFALQDRITREIAGTLAIRVTPLEERRVAQKPTANFDAYDLVLRARPALKLPTRANIVEARALLGRAIELDPNYAAAWSALGETFHVAVSMGWAESPGDYWKQVESHANEALRLDGADVRARVLLARKFIAFHDYAQARTQIDRAIAVNPNDAEALAGRGHIMVWSGDAAAAIETLKLAQRIDPELNAFDRFALSLAYYLQRRYAECIEQAELTQHKDPGAYFNQMILAAAYAQANRPAEAARMAENIRRADPTFDASTFGNEFLHSQDLAHLRDGLRKAGLLQPRK